MVGKAEYFETTPHGDEMRELVSHISITVTDRVAMQAVLVQVTYLDSGLLHSPRVVHSFKRVHLKTPISPVEATL